MPISRSLKNYGSLALIIIFLLISSVAVGIYKYRWQGTFVRGLSRVVPYPAVLVDWEIVRYSVFLEDLDSLRRYWQAQKENGNVFPAIPESDDLRSLLLDKTVENKIIRIYARKKGISVSSEEIDRQWRAITASEDLRNEVYDFLGQAYGGSDSEFKKKVLSNYLLRQKVVSFRRAQSDKTEAQLLQTALEIESKLKAGGDFALLASQLSGDAVSKINGGETGYFAVGNWPPPLEKAILQLKIGQVSPPVLFDSAYYLFKLEDLLYNAGGEPAQINVRQIVLKGFDFAAWLEEQKQSLAIYRFL